MIPPSIIIKVVCRDTILLYRRMLPNYLRHLLYCKKKKNLKCFVTDTRFYFQNGDIDLLNKYYIENGEKADEIISNADLICGHYFDVLGSGKINLGEKVDWCFDFVNDYKWNIEYYKDIPVVNDYLSDIKIPWELSRFYHFITLGKAYFISHEIKYYYEFRSQLLGWIKQNPFEYSVNWTCTMEVAIRACNWIFSYYMFEDCLLEDKEFKNILDTSLLEHGEFISRNLEKSLRGNKNTNHYISDLVGLVFVGLYFKEYKKASRWLNFALKELDIEIRSQILPDGVHYETSTGYHRLVLEQLLLVQILLDRNGYSFSANSKFLLMQMCNFLCNITNNSGDCPLIGDYDSGRLFVLEGYFNWSKTDFSSCLVLACICFNTDKFLKQIKNYNEIILLLNSRNLINSRNINSTVMPSIRYKDGGFYILRNEIFNCLIRCGSLSKCGGGHSHNDQLSFTLFVKDISFIVDPGTYVYTSDRYLRNKFRSTSMHNTLCFDGVEQNEIESDKLFNLVEQSYAKCNYFDERLFDGYHKGYDNKIGVTHKRKISIEHTTLVCIDEWDKVKSKYFNNYSNLILDNDVIIDKVGQRLFLSKGDICLELILVDYAIEETYIAKGYGDICKTKVVRYRDNSIEIKLLS